MKIWEIIVSIILFVCGVCLAWSGLKLLRENGVMAFPVGFWATSIGVIIMVASVIPVIMPEVNREANDTLEDVEYGIWKESGIFMDLNKNGGNSRIEQEKEANSNIQEQTTEIYVE